MSMDLGPLQPLIRLRRRLSTIIGYLIYLARGSRALYRLSLLSVT